MDMFRLDVRPVSSSGLLDGIVLVLDVTPCLSCTWRPRGATGIYCPFLQLDRKLKNPWNQDDRENTVWKKPKEPLVHQRKDRHTAGEGAEDASRLFHILHFSYYCLIIFYSRRIYPITELSWI